MNEEDPVKELGLFLEEMTAKYKGKEGLSKDDTTLILKVLEAIRAARERYENDNDNTQQRTEADL